MDKTSIGKDVYDILNNKVNFDKPYYYITTEIANGWRKAIQFVRTTGCK